MKHFRSAATGTRDDEHRKANAFRSPKTSRYAALECCFWERGDDWFSGRFEELAFLVLRRSMRVKMAGSMPSETNKQLPTPTTSTKPTLYNPR